MSMKNPNDTNGNQIRDLPACSAMPQPTAPPPPVLQGNNLFGNCIFGVRIPKIPRIYGKYYNIEGISNASICTPVVILTQELPKAYSGVARDF